MPLYNLTQPEIKPEQLAFIGRGMAFPVNYAEGRALLSEGLDRINQSITFIFNTLKGSKINDLLFGSDIPKFKFRPYSKKLERDIAEEIYRCLSQLEPRITVLDVQFDRSMLDDDVLQVITVYQVNNTNVQWNHVYPFSLTPRDMPHGP